jgi:pantoate--beta-alanine ligase
MILFKKTTDLHQWLANQRKKGLQIGFAPTMGALHRGHISLLQHSKKENDITVSSIFVNPTQFNDPKDFEKYPITLEADICMLEEAGCDALLLPSVEEMYPNGLQPAMHYPLGFLETVFDGKFRPGHFQGVCMVVHRLLEIVEPHHLYLGQKDYQQCMVITKLTELIKMDSKIKVKVCPTLREADGLAMSSRNMRLTAEERKMAPVIFQSLTFIKENLVKGDTTQLLEKAKTTLTKAGFKIDYLDIVDSKTLASVDHWNGEQKLTVLVAAFLNQIRLIDNTQLN